MVDVDFGRRVIVETVLVTFVEVVLVKGLVHLLVEVVGGFGVGCLFVEPFIVELSLLLVKRLLAISKILKSLFLLGRQLLRSIVTFGAFCAVVRLKLSFCLLIAISI